MSKVVPLFQIIHGRLRARCILLSSRYTAKISGFRPLDSRPLPLRWAAPEVIQDSIYSSKSDVCVQIPCSFDRLTSQNDKRVPSLLDPHKVARVSLPRESANSIESRIHS